MNGILANTKYYLMVILNWSMLVLFLISMAIFITLNLTPLMVFLSHHGISGVTHQQIMADYWRLMRFLQLPGGSLHFNFVALSLSGRQHFIDVKSLFMLNEAVLVVSGIISVLTLRYKKKKHQLWHLILPLQGFITAVPIFFSILAINFNHFFIRFHQLVFSNQDWLFNPVTDPIINVLDETFFVHAVLVFVILLELEFIILYFVSKNQSSSSE
ncbi:integral membrane protein [Paucilactobacillus hokkaidonensis JCM 18461]|uniref:Integral membrane protein n=2 Tax=Paucilactobacillus hokkaidonensis TaxID=1193095 RepID=A0A0A1GYG6_9LACO|nr:TIGR01906 family membrane protein [Paucilactobacillus hokkaidonensis]KRO07871.1 integral membrane protein [Paucilactobacillus hokkaidonensis]BAP86003.1 integral membrane protein [Paucilactobacillus hokkaidonensis JCM 18461]